MAEGMDEEQLVSFCHQLGLAKDGYLSEQDLSVVCRCIGLVAPEDMMKQLFEELDGDHDGRVCLAELSLMLRGMQLQPQTQKSTPYADKNGPPTPGSEADGAELSPMHTDLTTSDTDNFTFSILDPEHKGFAKVSVILELWSQLGLSPSAGQQVLKELGFSPAKMNSISVHDFGRSIEDEADHFKDADLPPLFLAAFLTYRTEAQYLRSLCESVECERDKLKMDLAEAHQRSTMMAQEVDEQNARLERNAKLQLSKMERKYAEQIQSLQQTIGQEKESLMQTIQQLESQSNALREVEEKLRSQIIKLKEENVQLENETKSLTEEVKRVLWLKSKVEAELTRYVELEKGMQDVERENSAKLSHSEEKLRKSHAEIQTLKDQNDELRSQLERMKDALDGKRNFNNFNRRRRKKVPVPALVPMEGDELPLEKMGKFHVLNENGVESEHYVDDAEAESSLEHVFMSCSSQGIDSGNFQNLGRVNLEGCVMDETCTETPDPEAMQTQEENEKCTENLKEVEYESLKAQVQRIEQELEATRAAFELERKQLRTQCSDLEKSLELLQAEYEKCEEYWHGKLEEERIEYEHDRNVNDEKFLELADKIKEYEELCMQQSEVAEISSKLPPIEERVSLERQVNDLDDECNQLREQMARYQRELEAKAREECNALESQIKALQQKCHQYEIRLTSITEDKESQKISELRNRVLELESALKVQNERHAEHLQDLELSWKRKNSEKTSQIQEETSALHTSHSQVGMGINRLELFGTQQAQAQPPPSVGPFWAQTPTHLPFYQSPDQALSLPYVPSMSTLQFQPQLQPFQNHNGFGPDPWSLTQTSPSNQNQIQFQHPLNQQTPQKKVWCHVEVSWLQALRDKLKQREDQCLMLQRALRSLEQQHEKILTDMKFQHNAEISNWEDLMKGSQELVRQQAAKQKEQAEKLAQGDNVIKDLWTENSKLVSAFNSAQHRVNCLESILKNNSQ